jgi:hypothetical protein
VLKCKRRVRVARARKRNQTHVQNISYSNRTESSGESSRLDAQKWNEVSLSYNRERKGIRNRDRVLMLNQELCIGNFFTMSLALNPKIGIQD